MDKFNLKNLQNKKIAALGLGVENLALVKFLIKQIGNPPRPRGASTPPREGNINITICDPKSAAELGDRFLEIKELARKNKLPEINLMTGKNYDAHLADFDIVFRSPGYPLFNPNLAKAKKAGVKITSAMELFFELCPTKNIIGVTGSKGKGTTSSLIYEIINASLKNLTHPVSRGASHPSQEGTLKNVWLGGNIGTAPFEFINKIKPNDWVVLELSSFQLEDLQVSPHIAVVTNLFKEHLAPADPNNPNYHKTMKFYWLAKVNIFAQQKSGGYLVVNEKLKEKILSFCHSEPLARNPLQSKIDAPIFSKKSIRSAQDWNRSLADARDDKKRTAPWPGRQDDKGRKIIFYGKLELASNLIGEHNKENIAAAVEVAKILKIKPEVVARAVKNFKGLPHRLEFVAEINGVKYFDDSFATVPDVSVIALKSFSDCHCEEFAGRRGNPAGNSKSEIASRGARNDKNIILLAGGADKGSDFKNFAREIKKRVKYLILFKGRGTDRLKKQISIRRPADKFQISNSIVDNMKDAVRLAKKEEKAGDIILLSTGCASFGCFKNYKERGEQFKSEVIRPGRTRK
jgi:UDP-N-acetylmuramoylalanine--D-glutamate ligase